MQFKQKHLLAALLLTLGAPLASQAQSSSVIVPPPPPLRQPVAAATPVTVAPVVAPPAGVQSANPAAAVAVTDTRPALIDIALPDAPKPVAVEVKPDPSGCAKAAPDNCDLRPNAPGAKRVVKKAIPKVTVETEAKVVKVPVDPFSGIVGTPVSDSQLNRFVFPEAVIGIYFQEGAPLPECAKEAGESDPCKPVFLNGKKVMLLQLRAGAKGPVQMVSHMASGRFVTMNLMPAAGPGAVVRVDGAEDGASDTRLAAGKGQSDQLTGQAGMALSEQHVALLARFAKGDIPAGFEPMGVSGAPVRFQHFDVIQQASWDNGANLRAHLYQVKAHGTTAVAISPALFRNENVRALALDRDTVTNTEPALLYMLEFVPTEQQ